MPISVFDCRAHRRPVSDTGAICDSGRHTATANVRNFARLARQRDPAILYDADVDSLGVRVLQRLCWDADKILGTQALDPALDFRTIDAVAIAHAIASSGVEGNAFASRCVVHCSAGLLLT